MPYFGKIKSYDSGLGKGTIQPNRGGVPLPFGKADLRRESRQPLVEEPYSFETVEVDGANRRATDLQLLTAPQSASDCNSPVSR